MYPFVRLAKGMLGARNAPPLGLTDPHISQHICWPWDIDPWLELNNGRTLTLYDLGRLPLAMRTGLIAAGRRNGWGMAVAGSTTRYRRRVRTFDRFEMRSRCIGWDARFIYSEQSMWRGTECSSHMLIRLAVTSKSGIVPTTEVLAAMDHSGESPPLPEWVTAWIEADKKRPWPPEM